jgi:NTE family protein
MSLQAVPSPSRKPITVAIACQGGGSHTAFTAGVLQTLLNDVDHSRYRIHGLSGTSGGALCAAIAWYGLLLSDPRRGAKLLESFWQAMSATQLPDILSNQFLVGLQRNRNFFATPEISPYLLPNTGQEFLAKTLNDHINFKRLPELLSAASPTLMIGAVDVLSGNFAIFNSKSAYPQFGISVDALLASAAIPELFRAVHIGNGIYWDGLFSQNPPIRGFLSGHGSRDAKPDEIWVIQINPEMRSSEPTSASDIDDRRNELAGNLSLNQELFFVRQTNDWLKKKWLNADHIKHVEIRHIELALELDYPSKLDRSPAFINALLAEGRRQGSAFLGNLAAQATSRSSA